MGAPPRQTPDSDYLRTCGALASDLLSHEPPALRRRSKDELGGWGTRSPLRRAQLLCSAGSVCQAVGGTRACSRQPALRRNSPQIRTSPYPAPGLLLCSLGKWGEKQLLGTERKGRGAKWDERRNATLPDPGLGLSSRCSGRPGPGPGWRAVASGGGAQRGGRGGRGPLRRSSLSGLAGAPARRSGDRALVPGCGKRPRSQPPETPPPPPHLVEETGKAARWGLGRRAPGWGRKGGGRKAGGCGRGLLRGKGPLGVRRGSLCHRRGIGAQGPWARSPEAEVAGGRGGGPREAAAAAGW